MKLDISNTRFSNAFKTFSFFFFPKLSPPKLSKLYTKCSPLRRFILLYIHSRISHSHLALVQIFKIFVYSKIIENIFQSDIYYRINSSVNLSFFCSISNICLQFLHWWVCIKICTTKEYHRTFHLKYFTNSNLNTVMPFILLYIKIKFDFNEIFIIHDRLR